MTITSKAKKLVKKVTKALLGIEEKKLDFISEKKNEIKKKYGKKKIFGIFSKDDEFCSNGIYRFGHKLVMKIAKFLCNKFGWHVITGKYFYYRQGKDIIKVESMKESTYKSIQRRATKTNKSQPNNKFCYLLGQMCDIGIFLMDRDKAGTDHEQTGFFDRKKFDLALGVVICDGIEPSQHYKTGGYIHQDIKKSCLYYECRQTSHKDCIKLKRFCLAKKAGVNLTTTEPYIITRKSTLIFVDDLIDIHKIILLAINDINQKRSRCFC